MFVNKSCQTTKYAFIGSQNVHSITKGASNKNKAGWANKLRECVVENFPQTNRPTNKVTF